jgi:epoxide hydrolase 4
MLIDDAIFGRNQQAQRAQRQPLQMPLLLLWGDSDFALLPNLLMHIGKVAPGADVRILPNCSHWVQQDAAEEVTGLIREVA